VQNRVLLELRIADKEKQVDIEEKTQEVERLKQLLRSKDDELQRLHVSQDKTDAKTGLAARTYSLPPPVATWDDEKHRDNIELENKRLTLELQRVNQDLESERLEKLAAERGHQDGLISAKRFITECEIVRDELCGLSGDREKEKELQCVLAESEQLKDLVGKLTTEKCHLEEQVAQMSQELSAVKQENAALIQEGAKLKASVDPRGASRFGHKPSNGPNPSEPQLMVLEDPKQKTSSLGGLEEENVRLRKQLDALNSDVAHHKGRVAKLEAENKNNADIIKSYDSNIMIFKHEIERLQSELQSNSTQALDMAPKLKGLEKERDQYKAGIESYRNDNLKYRKELEQLRKENQKVSYQLAGYEGKAKETEQMQNTVSLEASS
jgi:hypothetical protein